ncbi:diguanylate cyclase [Marinibactrum halimedae]|uniref:diguanylate cyclase n=1 Tax=Marinibactrum halimedae TaxID=1444977 RepID=A0AA37WQQ0_9GAMM|nr:diguanylate cyclase [Marinibactrum halimedae]MCD9458011.1 sensor domain-containing diguanylate cyclase [Marinibactrum halimedae]GLS27637.1 deoxynucleoside kinase [Marinibactrum halimedae]
MYSLSFFEENSYASGNTLSIKDILHNQENLFQEPGEQGLSFGWKSHPVWVKIKIDNTPEIQETLLLQILYPLLDELSVFYINHDQQIINTYITGDRQPFNQRPIFDTHFIFPITNMGDISSIYLRAKSSSSVQIPVEFSTQTDYYQQKSYQSTLNGVLFGLMISMIIYNFFLYCSVGRAAYLYYVLFVASFIVLQLGLRGIGYQFIWPQYPGVNNYAIACSGAFALFFLMLFAKSFLQLNEDRMMQKIINLMIAFSVSIIAATFVFSYSQVIKPLAVTTMAFSIIVIVMGAQRYRQGFSDARYYLLAWIAAVIGSMIYLSKQLGWLPINFLTEHSMIFGSCLEMLLLSLALADRLNTLRKHLKKAYQDLAAQNSNLEHQVSERTGELTRALEELTTANEKLARVSVTDKLTGLRNRYHFDLALEQELNRVKRNLSDMSLLLADIDHFKRINDNWGHTVGDQALQMVSDCLRSVIGRNIDSICRYGGEEFALILPSTNLENAAFVAEKIRKTVEITQFSHNGTPIPLTISVGVASVAYGQQCKLDEIVQAADTALYQAKDKGRNRICKAPRLAVNTHKPAPVIQLSQ